MSRLPPNLMPLTFQRQRLAAARSKRHKAYQTQDRLILFLLLSSSISSALLWWNGWNISGEKFKLTVIVASLRLDGQYFGQYQWRLLVWGFSLKELGFLTWAVLDPASRILHQAVSCELGLPSLSAGGLTLESPCPNQFSETRSPRGFIAQDYAYTSRFIRFSPS